MENITLADAWSWILAGAAAIVALSKAWEIIRKRLHPESDLRETIKQINGYIANDDRRLKILEVDQEKNREFEAVMCQVMLAQLNHELSGNDVTRLKDARDELQRYLSKRG